jgi:hypothetical protein
MAEEWDVFSLAPGGDYAQPEYLATLYNAFGKQIIVELGNTGSGQFSINRYSTECTEEILAQGNLVKVRIPEIGPDYIFAFFLETGDFTLISSQEQGGETLTFGGRGILSYLEYARAASLSFVTGGQDPIAGVWRAYAAGTGSAPGQILRRMLEEMQHVDRVYPVAESHPLPLLTIDFDYTDDSTAVAWDETDATDEFAYQVGEDGLAILLRLIETETIIVQMSPDFLLSAYNPGNFGQYLAGAAFGAGVVRFEKGVNIAIELRREQAATRVVTHVLVQGEADKYGGAVLSDAASRVTKEGFLPAFGTGTTALNAIGAVDLLSRLNVSDTIQFPINNRRTDVQLFTPVTVGSVVGPGATTGVYLPGPSGTNGDFWVGDTVRIHTGSGPFDYTEVDAVVERITIARNDDNAELEVFVEATTLPPEIFEQSFTFTDASVLDGMQWPEAAPSADNLLVGFIACRGPAGDPTDFIPWSVPTITSDESDIIAGTDWTHVDGQYVGNFSDYPTAIVYRIATADDTLYPLVVDIGGGTGRPRGHFIERAGLTGPPTASGKVVAFTASSGPFTSPDMAVPGAGRIYVGFSYLHPGPADNVNAPPGFVLDTESPAATSSRGYANSTYAPYSWFGYIDVGTAGTYSLSLTLTGKFLTGSRNYGWQWAFFPNL